LQRLIKDSEPITPERAKRQAFLAWQSEHIPHSSVVIHPTAIIDAKADLEPTVSVGAYAIIDPGVKIGAHCFIGPHAYITGNTTIGSHNRFFAGSVIGEAPQDLRYAGAATGLRIGDHNTFREHVTVHRSNKPEEDTVIGAHNFLMSSSHVGHNCRLGNHVIMANGALLGGHVTVDDRAFLSGNCLVHQFVRVGTLALMQGGAAISKDLPPYTVARGYNHICGLNSVGLRRAGLTPSQRLELKQLYLLLFRSKEIFQTALSEARAKFLSTSAKVLLEFLTKSQRGFCADVSRSDEDQS